MSLCRPKSHVLQCERASFAWPDVMYGNFVEPTLYYKRSDSRPQAARTGIYLLSGRFPKVFFTVSDSVVMRISATAALRT